MFKRLLILAFFTSHFLSSAENKELLSITPSFIKHKNHAIDIELLIKNNSSEGIDFTHAIWKLSFNNVRGIIKQSEFDGLTVGPFDQRHAVIIFTFEKELSFEGILDVSVENIKDFKNTSLKPFIFQLKKEKFENFDLGKITYK